MRLIIVGAALLVLSISLTEYVTRTRAPKEPSVARAATQKGQTPKAPKIDDATAALLATSADTEVPRQNPAIDVAPGLAGTDGPNGFKAVLTTTAELRNLTGGFGWAVFLADIGSQTALVRVADGEKPHTIALWPEHISSLVVDGSSLFFSTTDTIYSRPARGNEAVSVRVRFSSANILAFTVAGEGVVVALKAKNGEGQCIIARVDGAGVTTVLESAADTVDVLLSDGKEAFWLSHGDLFHAALDGEFSARLAEHLIGPLLLDGNHLVANTRDGLMRFEREGGGGKKLSAAQSLVFSSSSGVLRYAQDKVLFEPDANNTPIVKAEFAAPISGIALGGTSLFVMTTFEGTSQLYVK
jgi:hypothetical protein